MKKYYIVLFLLVLFAGIALYALPSSTKTIYVVSMTPDEMSVALKNGTIDGFISWEPFPTKAVFDGYGKSLVNSKYAWENHPSCALALSDDIKDENTRIALKAQDLSTTLPTLKKYWNTGKGFQDLTVKGSWSLSIIHSMSNFLTYTRQKKD